MPISLDQYRRLKQKAEDAKSEVGRAEGALQQLMSKLKEDFDCETIEEAQELLQKKTAERDAAEKRYDEELRKFEAKWGEKI